MFALKKNFGVIIALFLVITQNNIVLAKSDVYAYANDTIAGQPAILEASGFASDSALDFVVSKPDGVALTIATKCDSNGQANVEMYDYHTRTAGIYYLYAYSRENNQKTTRTSFSVIPDEISQNLSEITSDRTIANIFDDSIIVSVKLVDSYKNPLSSHNVKLVSSRTTDRISYLTSMTDEAGIQTFRISAQQSGISTLMAVDVGESVMLDSRLSVSFRENPVLLTDAGGHFLNIANAADFGPLAGFSISDLPTTIKKNENVNFTIKAIDQDGLTVQDYTGTVRFSAEGDNSSGVTLPSNYKFLATDLGQHQFNLGLSFAQDGTYKVIVNDLSDKFKKGEKTVIVGSTATSVDTGTGEKPVISTPSAGTYSQAEMTISGSAKSGSSVKIFDNDQQIGTVPVSPAGKFTYQTKALADGDHSLYVVSTDQISMEVIGTSEKVEIKVDITPPPLDSIELDPMKGIKPGSVINVKVFSEKDLTQATVIFNYDVIALNASIEDSSVYVGTIQAPADPGIYKLNVLLVDEMQNEKTYEDQATVTVDTAGGSVETPNVTPAINDPVVKPPVTNGEVIPVLGSPSQVSGLIAYGSDKRVTLVWDAASDDKLIKHYKIYHGSDVKSLSQVITTRDASTTWYVPNLENGKEYFFSVVAVDDDGNESTAKSEIVSGIPFMLEIKNALTESPTKPIELPQSLKPAAYSGPFPSKTSSTGPEILILTGISAVAGFFIQNRKRK